MTIFDRDKERFEQNQKHLNDPQKGDYWHEQFCAICAVVSTTDNHVTVVRDRAQDDSGQWFTKMETMRKKDFKSWLSYESIPGTWASVLPGKCTDPLAYLYEAEE